MSYPFVALQDVNVRLYDCVHATPAAQDAGYPYVAIPEVRDGRLDLTNVRRISEKDFRKWTLKLMPRKGDIIMTRRARVGDTAPVPDGLECAIGQNLVILRSEGSEVDQNYLRWALRGPLYRTEVQRLLNVGALFDSLNCADIPKIEIPLRPLPTQRAIAHILGTLDDKIELNRKMNETLEAIAKALFKSWFIDFDPVRAKMDGKKPVGMDDETAALFPSEFVDSELGKIPKGWEVGRVLDLSESIFSGGTPDTRKSEYWGGSFPWCSSGETRNNFIVETEKSITEAGIQNSSTRPAVPGDILIASAGQGHTRGQTSCCAIDTYVNQSVVVVRPKLTHANSPWLYLNLSARYEEMRGISDSHSSRGSLTTKLIGSMPCIRPPEELIRWFGSVVRPVVDLNIENRRTNRTLGRMRDLVLPLLISGALQVSLMEKVLEKYA